MQSDIFYVHNFVEDNYQYDTTELLEKHKVLQTNVCKYILMVIIGCPICNEHSLCRVCHCYIYIIYINNLKY